MSASTSAAATPTPTGLHVSGNQLLDSNNRSVRLIGVNRSGTEYGCVQGWGIFDGPSNLASVQAMARWHINTVRIPLNEDCWLGINGVSPAYSGVNYQQAIANYVNLLSSQGMYAVVELHWSAPGTSKATGQNPMPDADHSPAFWQSVANTFKTKPAVVFDLFNEPYPDNNGDTTAAWTCWKDGGTCAGVSYQVAGMQSLVSAVRGVGATNVILAGGVQYANSLTRWLSYRPVDPAGQLIAAAHIYGNNICGAQLSGSCLTQTIAPVAAQVPVVFGETGETYDNSQCTSRNMQVILPWADAHNVSYLAWTWNTWGNCLSLISDVTGTVNTTTPAGAAYASYVHDHLAAVASVPTPSPTPTPTPAPVSPIGAKWAELGGLDSFLGAPTGPEVTLQSGAVRPFASGNIYWSGATGAHEVHGAILGHYANSMGPNGLLGYPITDETATSDGAGRFNGFTGGTTYWTSNTGAHEVHGAILAKWASLGHERGLLGYPITDETATSDGAGRFNGFTGGTTYWTSNTGAHEVHGAILAKWASLGFERSWLGYPTTDEYDAPSGRRSDFGGGWVYWQRATGVTAGYAW